MSARGNFGSGQRGNFKGYPPGQRGRGGNQAASGYSNKDMNVRHTPSSQFYDNVSTTPHMVPPPSAALQPALGNPHYNNPGQYQITLSFNTPMPQGPSHLNVVHPPQSAMIQQNPGIQGDHPPLLPPPLLPPPYTPYAEEPSPPSYYHSATPSFDKNESLNQDNFEQGFRGRGRGSRMRGRFSQSCDNLNLSGASYAESSTSAYPRRGQGQNRVRGKGHSYKQKYSKGKTHVEDDDDDVCVEEDSDESSKSFDQSSSYKKRGRGRGNRRGRRRGGYGDKGSRNENHLDDENDEEESGDDSGESFPEKSCDQDASFNYRGRGSKTGFHRGRGGSYHKEKGGRRSSVENNNIKEKCSDDRKDSFSEFAQNTHFKHNCQKDHKNEEHYRDKKTDRGQFSDGGKSSNVYDSTEKKATTGARPKKVPEKVVKDLEVKDLEVTLHFKMIFENAMVLKSHIDSALRSPDGANIELSYDEIFLRHAENETICKFTISGISISIAKRCVKGMVFVLRKKLDTFIEWTFNVLGNEDVESKEMPKKPEKNMQGNGNEDGNNAKTENISKRSRNRHAKTASKKQKDQKPDLSKPVPTTVNFSVEMSFSSPESLKMFLKEKTSSLPFNIQVDDSSISLSAQKSKCMIHTKSKADARKLMQSLRKLQAPTNLEVMSKSYEENKSISKQKDMTAPKEKVMSSMRKRKLELLQTHEEKITKFIKVLMQNSSAKSNKETGIDLEAMQDKVSEAMKQKDEFLKCYDILYKKLEELDSSASSLGAISRFKCLFDIECNRLTSGLPIYAHRDDIIQLIKSNQVSIIVGGKGCGKSTQIAQYLFDSGYASEGIIVCTQPQPLAAVTLAERVANELSVKVGTLVGVKTSMNTKANKNTKILFAEDYSLLNECSEDSQFKRYSCIIVDEASEHSMYTDLLLGMIKSCLPHRKDLKIIILSSPSNTEDFMKYFKTGTELRVSGRDFRVEEIYTDDVSTDFENHEARAVSKAYEIHVKEDKGDILIFLSLPVETLRCCQEFEKRFNEEKNFKCLPLHNQLPAEELKKVFQTLPHGQRKIIFATKYAETSISIEGIRYVIDTGVTSQMKYDSEQKVNLTTTCIISQSMANQRKQCAARISGGQCYRLYSKKSFMTLAVTQAPEILRVHLEKAILKLLELNVNLKSYDFIQAPSEMAMEVAIETLTHYGSIDHDRITDVGKWISKLPFDPSLGFFIFEAEKKELLYDAVVLSSIITFGSDFSYRYFHETKGDVESQYQKHFGSEKMDSFAWLQVYKEWSELQKEQRSHWCRSKSIDYKLINLVRYCNDRVSIILLKDFNIEMKDKFSDKMNAQSMLKKLYLKSKHPQFSTF